MRCGKGVFESVRQASGLAPGASEPEELPFRVLVEVVCGSGLGLGGIEFGRLVEVVGEGFVGDLVVVPTDGPHVELGLGWSPGGMDQRGRGHGGCWEGKTRTGELNGQGVLLLSPGRDQGPPGRVEAQGLTRALLRQERIRVGPTPPGCHSTCSRPSSTPRRASAIRRGISRGSPAESRPLPPRRMPTLPTSTPCLRREPHGRPLAPM